MPPEHLSGRIIDMHTHFFPEKLFSSIWRYFTQRNWSIAYQDTPDGLARTLEGFGVARYTTYNYAHRPGIAAELNNWTCEFARRNPAALPFATVHPDDPGNEEMLETLFTQRGFFGMKLQPLVTDFYPCDERMFGCYRKVCEHEGILAIHAGTAPIANQYVGARYFEPVMEAFPEMKVVVAHMGAFEFDAFFDMARAYPNLYLDTSVNFIDPGLMRELVASRDFPPLHVPAEFDREVLLELSDRILFGSDYPNIPYTYDDCVESILRLDLGEEFESKVFYENARKLLGWGQAPVVGWV